MFDIIDLSLNSISCPSVTTIFQVQLRWNFLSLGLQGKGSSLVCVRILGWTSIQQGWLYWLGMRKVGGGGDVSELLSATVFGFSLASLGENLQLSVPILLQYISGIFQSSLSLVFLFLCFSLSLIPLSGLFLVSLSLFVSPLCSEGSTGNCLCFWIRIRFCYITFYSPRPCLRTCSINGI